MIPQISLRPQIFSPGELHSENSQQLSAATLRVDVVAQHLPQNFFGVAFDLLVPIEWKFDHVEHCGFVDFANPNIFHLASEQPVLNQQPSMNRVVFGLAIAASGNKNDNTFQSVPDACLVSFYFTQKAILPSSNNQQKIFFEHGVMSIFNNGRRDIGNVEWKGALLNQRFLESPSLSVSGSSSQQIGLRSLSQQKIQPQQYFQNSLFENSAPSTVGYWQSSAPGVFDVYELIFVVLLVGLVFFTSVFLYFRVFKKPENRPPP